MCGMLFCEYSTLATQKLLLLREKLCQELAVQV